MSIKVYVGSQDYDNSLRIFSKKVAYNGILAYFNRSKSFLSKANKRSIKRIKKRAFRKYIYKTQN